MTVVMSALCHEPTLGLGLKAGPIGSQDLISFCRESWLFCFERLSIRGIHYEEQFGGGLP
jgi:hypothetical protein